MNRTTRIPIETATQDTDAPIIPPKKLSASVVTLACCLIWAAEMRICIRNSENEEGGTNRVADRIYPLQC